MVGGWGVVGPTHSGLFIECMLISFATWWQTNRNNYTTGLLYYVLVISRYKDDILVITRDRGRAEVKCNNNDIMNITGYNWLVSQNK